MIFQASNLLVIPFWVLMIFAPGWPATRRVMASTAFIVPIALLYSVLVVPNLLSILPQLANPTLPIIQTLLSSDAGATTAWIHFLAFDLWVGRWVYLDAQEREIPVWLVSICWLVSLWRDHLVCSSIWGFVGLCSEDTGSICPTKHEQTLPQTRTSWQGLL